MGEREESKERKQVICATEKHYSSDFPQLSVAWNANINLAGICFALQVMGEHFIRKKEEKKN